MMRIVVIMGERTGKRTHLMLELLNRQAIENIKNLISANRCQDAIVNIMTNGKVIKELTDKEFSCIHSDLILTQYNAHWTAL